MKEISIPQKVKDLATQKQLDCIEAYEKYGSFRKAARALGIKHQSVQDAIKKARKKADRTGSDGLPILGHSTLTKYEDENGQVILQWEKTMRDKNSHVMSFEDIVETLNSELIKTKPVKSLRKSYPTNLLNCYTITDYHLGMYAWAEECGDDWDTDIAENLLVNWFKHAVSISPDAETAILANIGDFLHWDGFEAVTPTSRHILDADTRFERLTYVAIRVIRQAVNILLSKHKYVRILMCDANHDPASEAWMRASFHVLYENEPRVTVDRSADSYYVYEFGQTSLFFHHGHKRSIKNVDDVFVSKFRKIYGRTVHSYAHLGHLHHDHILETNLMKVERHRTLAAPDSYASRSGYMSGRDAKVITYDKDYGEIARLTISPDLVNACLEK